MPRIRPAPQVVDFIRSQAPEPRRRLRGALDELASDKGDIRQLEGPLQDYARMRVGSYRIIVRYVTQKTVECVFVERRGIVYEVFAETMLDLLEGEAADAEPSASS